MLERYLGADKRGSIDWESMGVGAPTIIGLARLCSEAMSCPNRNIDDLSLEAKAILFLCRQRGIFELRGTNDAFDSCDRLLTIYVELDEDQVVALKATGNVRQSVRFLEGLRQACEAGLILHQLNREFSLSASGYKLADKIDESEVTELLAFVQPVD